MTPRQYAIEAIKDTVHNKVVALDAITKQIQRAIIAEREACATLADQIGESAEVGPAGDCVEGGASIAFRIASTIRGRTL